MATTQTPAQLPESWQPHEPEIGDGLLPKKDEIEHEEGYARYGVDIPICDTSDPAQLEAWFIPGAFSHYDYYRKVVQALCHELLRAKAAAMNQKCTEKQLENLARLHPIYLTYLADSLYGRQMRERAIRERMGA